MRFLYFIFVSMKKVTFSFLMVLPFLLAAQSTIYRWTFNTKDSLRLADATVASGTRMPQIGNGTMQLAGTVINTFSDGVINDSSSIGDNSAIQLTTFPVNGTRRDTSGIVFKMNTSGYCNLFFSWYQRHSATSSRFVKLLYTIDGLNWIQYTGPGTDTTNSLYRSLVSNTFIYRTADFSGVAGVNNNPLFAIRIVSTFSPNGSTYLGTTSNYATSGTYRFDLVQLRAHPLPQIISPQKTKVIANLNGISVVEGNYQSLINSTNENEFYLVSGSGPQIIPSNLNCSPKSLRIYPSINYNPSIVKIKINSDSNFYSVLNERPIQHNFKTAIDGYLSKSISDFKKQEYLLDTITDCSQDISNKIAPYSENGYNPAGLVVLNNHFWFIDEFRSAFVCLNASYKIINRYSAFEVDSNFLIDNQLKYTRPGYGFRNLTKTPNQLLYSISAKPLFFDSITNSDRIHRLVSFDPISHQLNTYLVLNPGDESEIAASDWVIDDLIAISNDEFLIYEHAENQNKQVKRISRISINNATRIDNKIFTYNGNTGPVELLINESGLTSNQIVPATKTNYLDLYKNGLPLIFNSVSGVHLQNDSTLYLVSNNNNGLNSNTNDGAIVPAQVVESNIAIFKLTGDLKLNIMSSNNNDIYSLDNFSVSSSFNQKSIELDSINFRPLDLNWNASVGANFYTYSIDTTADIEKLPLVKNTILTTDTTFQLNFDVLKTLSQSLKLAKGDSVPIYLTIWSYSNFNDSLPSMQSVFCYLKSPLIPEAFNLLIPISNQFEANVKKGNALKLEWQSSRYADAYLLTIDTTKNLTAGISHLFSLNTTDNNLILNATLLDSLTQKLGLNYGDSIVLTFNVFASNSQGKSIKSANILQIYVKRENKILTNFNLISPLNGFNIEVELNDTGTLQLVWSPSANATSYRIALLINNKDLLTENVGNVLEYKFPIASVLNKFPLDRGDSLTVQCLVYALFNKNEFNDTLQALNTNTGTFRNVLIFEPIELIKPLPFVQYSFSNGSINQLDSIEFEWSNPNPFTNQTLNFVNSNKTDTVSFDMNNGQTLYSVSKQQLFDKYLATIAINDSIFINWHLSEKYKQAVHQSESRIICLKKIESTGFNELSDFNTITIYPNPVNHGLFNVIASDAKIESIQLFNQLGAAVNIESIIDNTKAQIKTEGLSGVFYLRIQFQNKVFTKSIRIH